MGSRYGRWHGSTDNEFMLTCTGQDAFQRLLPAVLVSHNAMMAQQATSDLELGLDQQQAVGSRREQPRQDGNDIGQRDERHIRNHIFRTIRQVSRLDFAYVDTAHVNHPRISGNPFQQLSVAHIKGDNSPCAMSEQNVSETARGSPDIKTEPVLRIGHPLRRKSRQSTLQLQRSTGSIVIARVQKDHIAWLDALSRP